MSILNEAYLVPPAKEPNYALGLSFITTTSNKRVTFTEIKQITGFYEKHTLGMDNEMISTLEEAPDTDDIPTLCALEIILHSGQEFYEDYRGKTACYKDVTDTYLLVRKYLESIDLSKRERKEEPLAYLNRRQLEGLVLQNIDTILQQHPYSAFYYDWKSKPNWIKVQQIFNNSTCKAGSTSSYQQCSFIGIDPDAYSIQESHKEQFNE